MAEMPDFGPPDNYRDPRPTFDGLLIGLHPVLMPLLVIMVGVCIAMATGGSQ